MTGPKTLPKEEELLSLASRVSLKHSLFLKRGMLTSKGWRPICAICGQPIMEEPDMHEAIITKGNVQGNFLGEELINTVENCVLVHPGGKNLGSCHSRAHSQAGRKLCIIHILKYVPKDQIIVWLDQVYNVMKTELAWERMAEVLDIYREQVNATSTNQFIYARVHNTKGRKHWNE